MSVLGIVLICALGVVAIYALNRLQSRTNRQALIPFDGNTFPRDAVRRTLEIIGCTIVNDSNEEVSGSLPLDGLNWGQVITVVMKDRSLLVSSSFSGSQIFGGDKNQENIDRFIEEWKQRQKHSNTPPTEVISHEFFVRKNARKTLVIGVVMTVFGGVFLALALFVPAQPGASPGNKYRLIGLAAPVLLMGLGSIWAGTRRLLTKPSNDLRRQ